ncbi:hypothetical protein SVAN01_11976 [Stagonosporopsis vannaccii]|nr:hypothetical protein SVAN01_11976 [Stagonosporopsis vannaccii]
MMFDIRTIAVTSVIAGLLSSSSAQYSGTLNATAGPPPKTITFPSGNDHVVGHLYLPEGYDTTQRYPAVAVAGSFISIKKMIAGTYALQLVTLSGVFRQYEDPASKAEDLSAGLEYLTKRSNVAGLDPRVQAVATVVGFFSSSSLVARLRGEEGVALPRAAGREAQRLYNNRGEIKLIPAYFSTANVSANFGPQPYYEDLNHWNPVTQAGNVMVPALMVHSENAAFPNQARIVYDRLGPQKEIIWTNGTHYEFYDNPHTVRFLTEKVAQHF